MAAVGLEDSNWIRHLKENVSVTLKDTVFGYIRQCETHSSANVIPANVWYICLQFLYEPECFEQAPEFVDISSHKRTITLKQSNLSSAGGWNNISFCKLAIDSTSQQVAEWTLEIKYNDPNKQAVGITFGLYGSDRLAEHLKSNPLYTEAPYYVHWSGQGTLWKKETNALHTAYQGVAGVSWSKYLGGEVAVRYNASDSTLHIKQPQANEFKLLLAGLEKGETIKYRLGCSFGTTASITLKDFKCYRAKAST